MTKRNQMFERGFKSWCENTSKETRKGMGLMPSDPMDPWKLAEHLGIVIWGPKDIPGFDSSVCSYLLEEDQRSWSAATLCMGSECLIIINSSHSIARKHSNLTHEIAHLLCGHEPARVDVSEDGLLLLNSYSKPQEAEADWLSGCLLLPREALIYIRKKFTDEIVARKEYGVSKEMFTWRIGVTGVDLQLKRARKKERSFSG